MWRAERRAYLVVGAGALQYGETVAGRWQALARTDIGSTPEQALENFSVPDATGDGLRVLVADRWLREVKLPWSNELLSEDGAILFAQAQLVDGGYLRDDGGTLRIGGNGYGQPRLALEYPAPLLDALEAWARRVNLVLRGVVPMSVAAWQQSKGKSQAVAVLDDEALIFAIGEAGVQHDVVLRLGDADWQGAWKRLQLRDPLLAGQGEPTVVETRGQAPNGVPQALMLAATLGQRRTQLDAVAQPASSWFAWVLAAGLAAFATGLLADAVQARQQAGLLHAEAEAAAQPVPTSASAPVLTKEELGRIAGVNAAIRELNMPIDAVLAALQPPRDLHVSLLSLQAGGGTSVRISAETRSASEMVLYAAFVGDRKPFTQAHITHHERESGAPEKSYRFTMEASWSD